MTDILRPVETLPAAEPVPPAEPMPRTEPARHSRHRLAEPARRPGQDEATRYMCAAAHLDSKFAERLVTQVLEEPFRAVVQSPALNLSAVLRHVAAARSRHLVRDGLLVCLLVMFLAGLFTTLYLLPLAIFLAWLVVLVEAYTARWGAMAQTLRRDTFDAAAAPMPVRPFVRDQIALAETYAGGNVTTYSGYEPFMGYGLTVDAWSMAVDVTTPHDDEEPIEPFTVDELHRRLGRALTELDFPRLAVHDRLFINGGDIHHDNRFLTGTTSSSRPLASVHQDLIDRLRAQPEDRARPYLVAEITGWGGEIVFSAFVRVALTSTSLFVEASYSLLPPMHRSYHEIDQLLQTPTFGQFVGLMARKVPAALGLTVVSIPRTARQAFAGFRVARKVARQQQEMSQFGGFNHGALISIREQAADVRELRSAKVPGYQRYFQFLDKEMYQKVVEKKIFDCLCDFLADHNVDPDELKRRVESIINNGVMVSGNATVTGGMFGGRGAKLAGMAKAVGKTG